MRRPAAFAVALAAGWAMLEAGAPPAPSAWAAVCAAAVVLLARRRRPRPRRGQVYLLRGPGGLHKIGWTGRPGRSGVRARVAELRSGCAWRIDVVDAGPGTLADEQALHRRYRHLRVHTDLPAPTEWFALGDRDVAEVRRALRG